MSAEDLATIGFLFPVAWLAIKQEFALRAALAFKREFTLIDWDHDVAFPVFEVVRANNEPKQY